MTSCLVLGEGEVWTKGAAMPPISGEEEGQALLHHASEKLGGGEGSTTMLPQLTTSLSEGTHGQEGWAEASCLGGGGIASYHVPVGG